MSSLSGKVIGATFKDILTVHGSVSNEGLETSLKKVEDGEGVESALELSTVDVNIHSHNASSAGLKLNGSLVTSTATELNLLDGLTSIKDEDNMASNSATSLATQQSIKAYIDTTVTAQDLDFSADTGGALNIDLDGEALTIAGGEGIDTSGANNIVTITGEYASATNKGIASFDATDFSVTDGDVALSTENLQDVIGGMVSSNTESGIAVTYDDGNGKLNFDVGDSTITLSGDVTGTGTITNLGNVSIATTIESDSTVLGTDTTGDYVASITGGTGLTSTGNTSGESIAHTLSVDASQTQITAVGTIGTGLWQGTPVARAYIANDAIDGTKIDDDVINSEHYVAGSIDNEHLADDAVNSDEIAAGAIDLAHMSVNSIDSDQYVDSSIDTAHIAGSQITNALMADDAIDSAEIADGAIDNAHMAVNSIDSDQYVDSSIDTAHIANSQITNVLMADDAIDSAEIADGAIDTAHIAGSQITNALMADNSVDSAEIVAGSVDNAHLAGSIANAKLSNSTITMSADTGTNDPVSLGETLSIVGTANEVNTIVSGNQIQIGLPSDVTITGDLVVNGDTVTVDVATLQIEDPLIKLAKNNTVNSVDQGIYGRYRTNGTDLWQGIFADQNNSNTWTFFKGNQAEPTTTVNTGGTGYVLAPIKCASIDGATIDGGTF